MIVSCPDLPTDLTVCQQCTMEFRRPPCLSGHTKPTVNSSCLKVQLVHTRPAIMPWNRLPPPPEAKKKAFFSRPKVSGNWKLEIKKYEIRYHGRWWSSLPVQPPVLRLTCRLPKQRYRYMYVKIYIQVYVGWPM